MKQSYQENIIIAFKAEFKKHIVKKQGRWGLIACKLKRTDAKSRRVMRLRKYVEWSW